MTYLTATFNACDRCGRSIDVRDVDAIQGGLVEGAIRDYCADCTSLLGATTCGGCLEIMQYDDLNADYLCCLCEKKAS